MIWIQLKLLVLELNLFWLIKKRIIKNSFKNSKIIEHYGLTEGVANIHQNIKNELIVDECYSYMELELHYKNTYKILGTNHHNFVFPLLDIRLMT